MIFGSLLLIFNMHENEIDLTISPWQETEHGKRAFRPVAISRGEGEMLLLMPLPNTRHQRPFFSETHPGRHNWPLLTPLMTDDGNNAHIFPHMQSGA